MPIFTYIAKSFSGEEKTGQVEAKDEKSLVAELRKDGFIPTSIKEGGEITRKKSGAILGFLGRIPLSEKMVFARNLAVMIESGMTISRAIQNLSEQTKNTKFKSILLDVGKNIQEGKTLADGLEKYKDVFGELFINMIRVGESSGSLEEVLKILATQIEKEHSIIGKVRGALVYPAVVVFAMVGVAVLMMIYVVPKLTQVFDDLGVELPVTTQIIVGISNFMAENTILFFIFVAVFIFLARLALKTKKGRRFVSFFLVNFPFVKTMTIKINCARFARIYSSLLRSGISVLEALAILSRTLTNHYYKEAMNDCREKIQKGTELSVAVKSHEKIFPIIVYQMIEVGEETGKTEVVMLKLAQFYEESVDEITKNLSSIIEPVLMILIGSAVGFFAISILQPMYSVMGNIQ